MIIAKTPLRITLGGGGTDLDTFKNNYGSDIISMAINKYIYIVIHNINSEQYILKYSQTERTNQLQKIKHKLIKQIVKDQRFDNKFELSSFADLDAKSGLGSSGSFSVGLTSIIHLIEKKKISNYKIAAESYRSEKKISDNAVGYQDHFISTFGGIKRFYSHPRSGNINSEDLKISNKFKTKIEKSFFLLDTGIKREAYKILYLQKQYKTNNLDILKLSKLIRISLLSSNLKEFSYLTNIYWQLKLSKGKFMAENSIVDKINYLKKDCFNSCKLIGAGYGGFILGVSLNIDKSKKILKLNNIPYFQIKVSEGLKLLKI
jgi:D-glycero-alpha-D-manno-heptose-7-phosphate kinase